MILVDSSVWIDFLRGVPTLQVERLKALLPATRVAIGDLILAEVLQGIDRERDFNRAREMFGALVMIELGGAEVAVEAARNYRKLRAAGVTPRKTIDTIIATRCMMDGHALLFSDRDFLPFVEHLGLTDAMSLA
jgi:predicted nucleic acid-binding protein